MSLPELGLEGAVSRVASTDSALVMVDTQDTAVTLSLSSFSLVSKLAGYSHTANISAHSLSPDSQIMFLISMCLKTILTCSLIITLITRIP